MQGDFSTGGFPPEFDTVHLNYHQVVFQQGRVFRDADFNEQSSLLLRYLQSAAADLIGQHGGPAGNLAFVITTTGAKGDFSIRRSPSIPDPTNNGADLNEYPYSPARYYVDGILCEQSRNFSYLTQPDYPNAEPPKDAGAYLAYLDVWYRYVSDAERNIERNAPATGDVKLKGEGLDFSEVALNLAGDTCGRAQIMAQVKLIKVDDGFLIISAATIAPGGNWRDNLNVANNWDKFIPPLNQRGRMTASVAVNTDNDPCLSRDGIGYSGPENQLYRVEIHEGGNLREAKFKWSRENGSVLFHALCKTGLHAERAGGTQNLITVSVSDLNANSPFQLPRDSVVEIIRPTQARRGVPGPLYVVKSVVLETGEVTLQKAMAGPREETYAEVNVNDAFLLRRWDNPGRWEKIKENDEELTAFAAIPLFTTDGTNILFEHELEYGLKAAFSEAEQFFPGDYWLIPARPAIGGILWPKEGNKERELPPHGITHHYAPLAILKVDGLGAVTQTADLQLKFKGLARLNPL